MNLTAGKAALVVATTLAVVAAAAVSLTGGSSEASTTTTTKAKAPSKPKSGSSKQPSKKLSGLYVFNGEINPINEGTPSSPGCAGMPLPSGMLLRVNGSNVTFANNPGIVYGGTVDYLASSPGGKPNGMFGINVIHGSPGTNGSFYLNLSGTAAKDGLGISGTGSIQVSALSNYGCNFTWTATHYPNVPGKTLKPAPKKTKPATTGCLTSHGFANIDCLNAAVQAAARAGTSPGIVQGGIPDDVATCKPANANLSNGSYVACGLLSATVGGAQEIVQIHSSVPPGFTSLGVGSSLLCNGLNAGEQAAFSAGGWQCVKTPPTTTPPTSGSIGNTGASSGCAPGNNGVNGVCIGPPLNNP
jgi:hypothetical protein